MSSTLSSDNFPGHDFSAAACIDGVWGGGTAEWSFCHTASAATNAWLSVQLSSEAFVSRVVIYGRSDCCQQHLASYQVFVGNAPGDPTAMSAGMSRCQPNDALTAPATTGPFT
eukprot:7389257-Prymnesium_polylepis.2